MPMTLTLPNGRSFFFWRKKKSQAVDITESDPSYKVLYLGNILTPWAKGTGCEEKALQTLWKAYTANPTKLHIPMDLTVCNSGMKASTKKHDMIEYWAYRVTYCCAPKAYPGVFCWVYRHEGPKMKQEFRFHAALCPKPEQAKELVTVLNKKLAFALQEFRREKLNRQKARLSLANSCYDCPSMPRRKLLLYRGTINFRPPVEMTKIAPKLTDIEEALDNEEEEEAKFFTFLNKMRTLDEYLYFDYASSFDSDASSSYDYGSSFPHKNSVGSLNSIGESSTSSEEPSILSGDEEQNDEGLVDLSEHALLLLS